MHFGLSAFHLVKGEGRRARTIGEEFLEIAERHRDPAVIVGHRLLGITSFILGELVAAREHLTRASAMYEPSQHRALTLLYGGEPEMSTRNYLGMTLWLLGYPDQAMASHEKALGLAREVTNAQSRAHALAFASLQHQFRSDSRRVSVLIQEMLALTADQGLRLWRAYGSAMHGWLLTSHGDIAEGIDEIQANLAELRAFGAQHFLPYFLCQLASAYRDNGRPAKFH